MKRRAWLASLVLALLSGCSGTAATPAEEVPELAELLSAVDGALASQQYEAARRHLADLIQVTEQAREAGDLEDAHADRVLAAAAHLLTAIPQRNAPSPQPEPGPTTGTEPEGDDYLKKLEEERKKLEEERKKLEEERKKEDGGGNGDSGGNGPDDGEGN